MEKVLNFLSENPIFYFATVEDNKPKVRPFGFFMEHEGKLYFGMGDHKLCYKQVQANKNVEISTANAQGQWIRISGTAVFDDREDALKKAFETMPSLTQIYNEQTGFHLALFYLDNIQAEIADMKGNFEKITF
ncbi:pyridoxamine 5'-phosphate oxidase family protein [Clostridium lundense]|uniref:pyridoxamine 5'-phosphate oxidase family protein n=1 Tax=Clostridium lundense TaxID=319475 RepID=UPI000486C2CA|nr:pyridoxamine 5'-phosphate oxidase family protein [Clostridium lundense]